MSKLEVIRDFGRFLKQRKRYWLLPMLLVLILFGALLVFAHGSAVSPFIYTLF